MVPNGSTLVGYFMTLVVCLLYLGVSTVWYMCIRASTPSLQHQPHLTTITSVVSAAILSVLLLVREPYYNSVPCCVSRFIFSIGYTGWLYGWCARCISMISMHRIKTVYIQYVNNELQHWSDSMREARLARRSKRRASARSASESRDDMFELSRQTQSEFVLDTVNEKSELLTGQTGTSTKATSVSQHCIMLNMPYLLIMHRK
jgi:hypothetical protein